MQGPVSGNCAGTVGTGGGGTVGTIGSFGGGGAGSGEWQLRRHGGHRRRRHRSGRWASFGAAQGPVSGNCAGTVGTGGGGTVGTIGSFGAAQGPVKRQLRRHGGHRRRRHGRDDRGSFGAAQGPVSGNCAGTVGTGGGGTVSGRWAALGRRRVR